MENSEEQTREFLLRAEIEEAQERRERVFGKARRNAVMTDEQAALTRHLDELQRSLQILEDTRLARSMSNAMASDGALLSNYEQIDRMEAEDRTMALRLSNSTSAGASNNAPRPLASVIRSSKKTKRMIASTSSASNPNPYIKTECAICLEAIGIKVHLNAPCGHLYDQTCLVSLIQTASIDESSFPPRCCRQPIPRETFIPLLSNEVRISYEKSATEFSTRPRDRIYCSTATCSAFLGAGDPKSSPKGVNCIQCGVDTCSSCREVAHPGQACAVGGDIPVVGPLLVKHGWQRCPECHRVIELTIGCFHITCVCSAQFCYRCAVSWKTCKCPHWEERLLLVEAERRVDAEIDDEDVNNPAPAPEQDGQRHGEQRRNRIEDMADRLRENHACNHNWQRRRRGGTCSNCSTNYRRFLMRCQRCYIDVCLPCARNRM